MLKLRNPRIFFGDKVPATKIVFLASKHETNDIMNEIKRMEGIIGDMVRPVRGDYLTKLQARKSTLESDLMRTNLPPPPRM